MARAAATALFAVVCCLLVAPAPARRPAELPPQQVVPGSVVDRKAAAEPLLPKLVAGAEAADDGTGTGLAVPEAEEEGPAAGWSSSLLCRFFWCDHEEPPPPLGEWDQPAATAGTERSGEERRPCDSDSDSDSDSDWDSDTDDEEGGIVGWFWSLTHRF